MCDTNPKYSVGESIAVLVRALGPKPTGIILVTILCMVIVVSIGYSIHSFLNWRIYEDVSKINQVQIRNLDALLTLNDRLREKNRSLEEQSEKLMKIRDDVLEEIQKPVTKFEE